jgi:hypothetical protein
MADEGKDKFTDLSPIRTKKIRASYSGRRYRVKLSGLKTNYRPLVLTGIILIILLITVNSTVFKIVKLSLLTRNSQILVGFQNSAELRPTGGFWGSFAILKIGRHYTDSILRFDTNPYKKDNLIFQKSTIALPKPMAETWPGKNQSFVNANYQASYPEAAKSLQWFLSEGWNEQTDGVIAISSLAIIDLLKLTGEVEVDQTKINADNFTEILSQKIDRDYWLDDENKKINEPKTILKDLAPILLSKAKRTNKIQLFKLLVKDLNNGYILAYFNDSKMQKLAKELNISGEIYPQSMDYLFVNNANLNGGKSSLNVEQSIRYSLQNRFDKLISSVSVNRKCKSGWPDILNRNYTRIFVPLGSRLISAYLEDEDITNSINVEQDGSKTSFGAWFSVAPGEDKTLQIFYELPFEKKSLTHYNLICQKQPGTIPDNLTIEIEGSSIYQGKLDKSIQSFSR